MAGEVGEDVGGGSGFIQVVIFISPEFGLQIALDQGVGLVGYGQQVDGEDAAECVEDGIGQRRALGDNLRGCEPAYETEIIGSRPLDQIIGRLHRDGFAAPVGECPLEDKINLKFQPADKSQELIRMFP